MRLSKFYGLLALSIIILSAVPLHAQGLSAGLKTADVAVPILSAQTIAASGTAVSAAIVDPEELKSIEYDASGTGFDAPAVSIKYSNSPTGPWVAGTGSGFDNTVTLTVTPTSGAPIKPYNFKYAQFTLTATATGPITLNRFTGLRRKVHGDNARPVAFVDTPTPIAGAAGITVTAASNSAVLPAGNALLNPDEYLAFFLASTGGAGESRTLRFYYSNSPSGPFVAWEDPGSVGYQNSVAGTAITMAWHVKPFPALCMKVRLDKAAGANMPVQALIGTRRKQESR